MKYIRIAVLALMTAALSSSSFAQNARNQRNANQNSGYTVSGRIYDAADGTPLELVNITFENNSFWAVSDLEGRFSLKLSNGEYHYEVSYIGYETAKGVIKVDGSDVTGLNIKLRESSLALSEVTVTAKAQAMGSSSVVDKTALQHLQPKSVSDILQLVPGNITQNPTVNSIGQAYIREIDGSNSANSMGALVMVDGAPISNDATLQLLSSSNSGSNLQSSASNDQNTTGRGTDLRSISTDNIDNIEVVRGIPSAEYGNLTSGAVIINSKKGATPLEIKGEIDPDSKMFYAGKGFNLNGGGTVNMAVDYTSSYSDIRFPAEGFERVTADLGYGHTFFSSRPLRVNFKVSYFQNVFDIRSDKQQRSYEKIKSENQGVRINLSGDWNIKTRLISNLSYNLSYNNSRQYDYQLEQVVLSTGITPIAVSTVSGEFQSILLNSTYNSEHSISGNPVNVIAQLKANKTIFINEGFTSSFKEGVEFKYDINHGKGLEYDPAKPPFVRNIQTVRPRPYSDIPAMKTLSGYIENKTIMPIGGTDLTTQIGVRASDLFIDRDYLDRSDMITVDPRINVEWAVLTPRNSKFENLSINAGWGLTSKMPPLSYLYPDKAYYDVKSFTYVDQGMDMSKSMSVMTTNVIDDTSNPALVPSVGNKFEVSLNFDIKPVKGFITFFKERYDNEFGYRSEPVILPYRTYLPAPGSTGYAYADGRLTYMDGSQAKDVPSRNDTVFNTFLRSSNGIQTDKMGIEYSIDFGQIKAIRTSIVADGAWLWIKRRDTKESWSMVRFQDPIVDGRTNADKTYPFMALMPAGDGSVQSRVNTNIRFITHIPRLSLIFSTIAQIVWAETYQSIYEDEKGNNVWYMGDNPTTASVENVPLVDPVGYRDFAGNYYEWKQEYRNRSMTRREYLMTQDYTYAGNFDKITYPATLTMNFRLTKQFSDILEISFMANNMFNTRRLYKSPITGSRTNLAIPQYFGAEIKLKL
ncbi:MAG: carboxypeptidase-like regulatory domain-containing protein [Bacteroidaceae bacterium]|nr:carboxypeptidase-like regulatory domain-containing protein [Bacteroidaceae bacterium]